MPDRTSQPREAKHHEGVAGWRDCHGLVRSSHVFAAVVRETLELNLLREVTTLPLNLSQLYLLKLMTIDGQHQVGQVAGFLGVSPPAATKNIDKLVRLGLINRSPSEGDRRATLLSVSPQGRRLVERYETLKAVRLAPVLASFSRRDLENLRALLEKLSVALLEQDHVDQPACLRCAAYLESGCAVGVLEGGCRFEELLPISEANRGARQAWQGVLDQ